MLNKYKRRPRIVRLLIRVTALLFLLVVGFGIEMALIITAGHLSSTEAFLAWLIALLAAIQLFAICVTADTGPSRYEFVPVERGGLADYFSDGEPTERLKDGWEVHQITTEGVLFKR